MQANKNVSNYILHKTISAVGITRVYKSLHPNMEIQAPHNETKKNVHFIIMDDDV